MIHMGAPAGIKGQPLISSRGGSSCRCVGLDFLRGGVLVAFIEDGGRGGGWGGCGGGGGGRGGCFGKGFRDRHFVGFGL